MRWRSSRPGYVQSPKYVSTPESVPCAQYFTKKLKENTTARLKHKSIHAQQTSGRKQLKIQISLLQNDSCLFFPFPFCNFSLQMTGENLKFFHFSSCKSSLQPKRNDTVDSKRNDN